MVAQIIFPLKHQFFFKGRRIILNLCELKRFYLELRYVSVGGWTETVQVIF